MYVSSSLALVKYDSSILNTFKNITVPVPIGYYPKWFIAGVCVRWPATSAEARHALPATDEKIQGDRYRYI